MFRLLNLKVKKRTFGYQPRYYDSDKEELEQRINDRQNKNRDGAMTKSRLKQEFGAMRGTNGRRGESNFFKSASFYRLLLVLIVLFIATYVVLNTWLPQFIDMLFPQENMNYQTLPPYEYE